MCGCVREFPPRGATARVASPRRNAKSGVPCNIAAGMHRVRAGVHVVVLPFVCLFACFRSFVGFVTFFVASFFFDNPTPPPPPLFFFFFFFFSTSPFLRPFVCVSQYEGRLQLRLKKKHHAPTWLDERLSQSSSVRVKHAMHRLAPSEPTFARSSQTPVSKARLANVNSHSTKKQTKKNNHL